MNSFVFLSRINLIWCRYGILLLGLISVNLSFAAVPRQLNNFYQESAAYRQYISNERNDLVLLSESFGRLNHEAREMVYTPQELRQHYLDKVCKGVYLVGCKNNLQNILEYNQIDLSSESGLNDFPYSQVDAYSVVYTTPGMNNLPHPVSGAILIPRSSQALKGIVVFYHYTVLDKGNVPSNLRHDSFQLSKLLAAGLASDGYVVLLPDYLGLGIDKAEIHPYMLYPQVNALSGIYMLNALASLAPELEFQQVDRQTKVFISGYSEGGSYALWAAKIMQENSELLRRHGYRLQNTAVMEGAYNLSHVTLPFLYTNLDDAAESRYLVENQSVASFVKPGLVANVLNSYARYGQNNNLTQPFNETFSACSSCTVDDQVYDIGGLLQAPLAEIAKYKILYTAAGASGYSDSQNSIASLAHPGLITNPEFLTALNAADIYNWRSLTPISLISLSHDSIVPVLNSKVAYLAMTANQSPRVKLIEVPNQNYKVPGYLALTDINVDHPQGLSFLLLFVRNEFAESPVFYVSKN